MPRAWNHRIRIAFATVILATLGVWPLIHGVFGKQFGVDPWRLAGFGMFSTIHRKYHHVGVVVVPRGQDIAVTRLLEGRIEPFQWWHARKRNIPDVEVVAVEQGQLVLASRADARTLKSLAARVKTWRETDAVMRLATAAARVTAIPQAERVFVIISEPRLRAGKQYVYRCVYPVLQGRVTTPQCR